MLVIMVYRYAVVCVCVCVCVCWLVESRACVIVKPLCTVLGQPRTGTSVRWVVMINNMNCPLR